MRNIAGVACAIVAIPVAAATMLFAAGCADPEADSAAPALAAGGILGLAATTILLGVAASALRASSTRFAGWRASAPLSYWFVVGAASAVVVAELISTAQDELKLDALYLGGIGGLLAGLGALMAERIAWGAFAAAALSLALAGLGFREGPYEPTLGYWLPRALAVAAGVAIMTAVTRRAGERG